MVSVRSETPFETKIHLPVWISPLFYSCIHPSVLCLWALFALHTMSPCSERLILWRMGSVGVSWKHLIQTLQGTLCVCMRHRGTWQNLCIWWPGNENGLYFHHLWPVKQKSIEDPQNVRLSCVWVSAQKMTGGRKDRVRLWVFARVGRPVLGVHRRTRTCVCVSSVRRRERVSECLCKYVMRVYWADGCRYQSQILKS